MQEKYATLYSLILVSQVLLLSVPVCIHMWWFDNSTQSHALHLNTQQAHECAGLTDVRAQRVGAIRLPGRSESHERAGSRPVFASPQLFIPPAGSCHLSLHAPLISHDVWQCLL